MKNKHKREVVEWVECNDCSSLILTANVSEHESLCGSFSEDSVVNSGFILDGKLYAQWGNIPANFTLSGFLILNPHTINQLQLYVGVHVHVTTKTSLHALLRVYADKSVHRTSVLLSPQTLERLQLEKHDLVQIDKFSSDVKPCKHAVFQCLGEDQNCPVTSALIKSKVGEEPLIDGEIYTLYYYGKKLQYKVNIEDALTDELGSLSINESGSSKGDPPSFFTSTPVKQLKHCASPSLSQSPSTPTGARVYTAQFSPPTTRGYYLVTSHTKLSITSSQSTDRTTPKLTWDHIGGMRDQKEYLSTLLQLFFTPTESKEKILEIPKGILIYGPHGSGKTMIGNILLSQYKCIFVRGPDVFCKFYGETEAKLKGKFEEASSMSPCVLFLDEVDALCTAGGSRVASTLSSQLDGVACGRVLVICTTCDPDTLPASLRTPGRLEKEIELTIPLPTERKDILHTLLKRCSHCISDTELETVADSTHGFMGADLKYLLVEASLHLMHRNTQEKLNVGDLISARHKVKPSAMRAISVQVPKTKWSDIGGGAHIKLALQQTLTWPLTHPEAFTRLGINPVRGILLYGPPGCCKTMIAKAVAHESQFNFLSIKGAELLSKYVGESERSVRELFRKARSLAPSIIFFDELDALAASRSSSSGGSGVTERVLSQLLTEIDGITPLSQVTLLAATNRPDIIDEALLRPGRLDRQIYVPLPDDDTRKEIFQLQFSLTPVCVDVDVVECVGWSRDYSGAEVIAVCQEAALAALSRCLQAHEVTRDDFISAFSKVKPRISKEMIQFYTNYNLRDK